MIRGFNEFMVVGFGSGGIVLYQLADKKCNKLFVIPEETYKQIYAGSDYFACGDYAYTYREPRITWKCNVNPQWSCGPCDYEPYMRTSIMYSEHGFEIKEVDQRGFGWTFAIDGELVDGGGDPIGCGQVFLCDTHNDDICLVFIDDDSVTVHKYMDGTRVYTGHTKHPYYGNPTRILYSGQSLGFIRHNGEVEYFALTE